MGRSARDLRARPAPHAERGGVLPTICCATRDRARLHHQQRLPDGAASAGLLRAHDGRGDRRRCASMPERGAPTARRLRGLRGYHMLPEAEARGGRPAEPPAQRRRRAHARGGSSRRCRCCPTSMRRRRRSVSRGAARPGPAAGGPARAQLLAAADGRSVVGRAAGGAARQRHRAVHPQRAAQAADDAHAGARQAHRERVGGRGAVLPEVQDHAASAHQHGQGRAQHDDAHVGDRLPRTTAST